jgi:hypothetical protein
MRMLIFILHLTQSVFFNVREADCFIKAHLHARFSRKNARNIKPWCAYLGRHDQSHCRCRVRFRAKNVANVNSSYVMLINIGKVFSEKTAPARTLAVPGNPY